MLKVKKQYLAVCLIILKFKDRIMNRKKKGYIITSMSIVYIIVGILYWFGLYRFDIVAEWIIKVLSVIGGLTLSTMIVMLVVIWIEAKDAPIVKDDYDE